MSDHDDNRMQLTAKETEHSYAMCFKKQQRTVPELPLFEWVAHLKCLAVREHLWRTNGDTEVSALRMLRQLIDRRIQELEQP